MLTLDGCVEAVIFQNKENGFCIIKFEVEGEEQTVLGTMPDITEGESLSIQGYFTTHPSYGLQFRAQLVERKMPEGRSEIMRYLSAGTITGVGKATAKNLVNTFGDEVLEILEKHPERLAEVKGITKKRADTIQIGRAHV